MDSDRNCRDSRQEVLIAESLIPVTLTLDTCKVLTGLWVCPYTGRVMTSPDEIDIDHVVPLKEAHISGAEFWNKDKRINFANFLDNPNNLIAVWNSANRSKGDRDPTTWMPSNIAFWGKYLLMWVNIKHEWGLSMDDDEIMAIKNNQQIYNDHYRGFKINEPLNCLK